MTTKVSPSVFRTNITKITTTYTINSGDGYIGCDSSGGSYTVSLPPVTGLDGKVYTIQKRTTDLNNIVIAANGSDDFDGNASKPNITLDTKGECVEIICDETNATWRILRRDVPAIVTSFTPSGYQGIGTPTSVSCLYTRFHGFCHLIYGLTTGTVSGSQIRFNMPTGMTIGGVDTTALVAGCGTDSGLGTRVWRSLATRLDTYLEYSQQLGAVGGLAPAAGSSLGSTRTVRFYAWVPINEWEG